MTDRDDVPRYLLETGWTPAPERDRLIRLAAKRFPEVALERRVAVGDERGARDIWVVRAPSDTHVKRWVQVGRIELCTLRRIDTDELFEAGPRGQR